MITSGRYWWLWVLLGIRQPFLWGTFQALVQVANLAVLGFVGTPPASFLCWAYFCIVTSLRSEVECATSVILDAGDFATALRMVLMFAFVWMGAVTSRVMLNVLDAISDAGSPTCRTKMSACL